MPHNRTVVPTHLLAGDELTAAMVAIGMNFAAAPGAEPNIEDTLVAASVQGMDRDDHRVLAVLVTWLRTHYPRVNADRLRRAVEALQSPRTRAFWSAVGHWLKKDRRIARLSGLHTGPRIGLLRTGNEFQVRRRGEDSRFSNSPLRVPAGVLRDRPGDVLTPRDLARRHATYRCRVKLGPSYRADMWAQLENDPTLSPADLARRTYGSFATAWQVKRDWQLLNAA